MRGFVFLACLLSSAPAFATGGFSCTADDENLKFLAESGFSYSMGGPFLNFTGTIDLAKALAPKGLEHIKLDAASLPHHWLHDDELKLSIYTETAGETLSSLELVVQTKRNADDETVYEGEYVLSISAAEPMPGFTDNRLEKRGKVTCSVG
ncbi:hypothetical protein LJR030_000780 [Rhizobium sp. LjRoot30]|uniref:hypothetical protein n=1 Tax=Rhizobium sp. LjRoot30 TaxID=3342320 RepID=UPI003ED0FE32